MWQSHNKEEKNKLLENKYKMCMNYTKKLVDADTYCKAREDHVRDLYEDEKIATDFKTDRVQERNLKVPENGFILKTPSEDGNLFIEQLISDRLKDLVAIQPNGEIQLNMREQISERL